MTERPIIFSGQMVRAILEGRKTQTRRIVKRAHIITTDDRHGTTDAKCPYGVPGDLLWVRETWRPRRDEELWDVVQYAADHAVMKPTITDENSGNRFSEDCDRSSLCCRWRPSIFMPRWASRITLEVTGVRVERVRAISEKDAWAEGVRAERPYGNIGVNLGISAYMSLWDTINGPGAWDRNDWVWVIEFKLLEAKRG